MHINYYALLHLNSVRINLLALKRSLINNMMDLNNFIDSPNSG